jgi:hypothetical protein
VKFLDSIASSENQFVRNRQRRTTEERMKKASLLCIYFNVTLNPRLTSEDVTIRPVLFSEPVLHGHFHLARNESCATRSASSGAAGVVNENASFVGRVEDCGVDCYRRCGVGSQKEHLAGDRCSCTSFRFGNPRESAESLCLDLCPGNSEFHEGALNSLHHRGRAADVGPPIISALPKLIHVPSADSQTCLWLEPILRGLAHEAQNPSEGSGSIVHHLTGVMFVQAVRAWIGRQPKGQGGWLGALRDNK